MNTQNTIRQELIYKLQELNADWETSRNISVKGMRSVDRVILLHKEQELSKKMVSLEQQLIVLSKRSLLRPIY